MNARACCCLRSPPKEVWGRASCRQRTHPCTISTAASLRFHTTATPSPALDYTSSHDWRIDTDPYTAYTELRASLRHHSIDRPPPQAAKHCDHEARCFGIQRMDMVRIVIGRTIRRRRLRRIQHRHFNVRHNHPQHHRRHVRDESPQLDGKHRRSKGRR